MKKIALACMVMVAFCACKKNSTAPYGSIRFGSATYGVSYCLPSNGPNTLIASNYVGSTGTNAGTIWLNVVFDTTKPAGSGMDLPTASGIDTVAKYALYPPSAHQVTILFNVDSTNYISTGGNGSNQTVTVTVTNGNVAVSGTNIELVNQSNPSDSIPLTFSIVEE